MLIHKERKSGEVKTGRQCRATCAKILSRRSEWQSTNRNGECKVASMFRYVRESICDIVTISPDILM